MAERDIGRMIVGQEPALRRALPAWESQPVDQEWLAPPDWTPDLFQTTLVRGASVTGPGTFFGKETRTLHLDPTEDEGWSFDRTDLVDNLPIQVFVGNVWTTVRNIVLRSGSPHNYMRMAEHIIALRPGLGLDNVRIRVDSGDPPLFDRSSLDLVEAAEKGGLRRTDRPVSYVTVREPVWAAAPNGSFLRFEPCAPGSPPRLRIDCSVNFPSAIGKQRIVFDVTPETFRHGAFARTNATLAMMMYCKTVGRLFADIRHLGYTRQNILIAGRNRYWNEPRMVRGGKSLEAAWHRATLDLLAALALVHPGRFAGTVTSYKAGHALDVLAVTALYRNRLLVPHAGGGRAGA